MASAICGRKSARKCHREMSRKLLLTQKQITAICKGASKAGFVPVIEVNGVNVKLVPAETARKLNQTTDERIDKPIEIGF
ncbi:hypothetical protein EOA32_00720 [Mesorhizobium sp. M1A.F.Ca.ET.072.01.1.1]|uniref:hypothetical protein n=1 Tax=Mesorhizobium sp. M1A.F.Ca.ET.072.01.1.1 TaxID=2496753 RepID=UPI000FD3C7EE|nr:hypothetical protein [Mesorhizobium sp. M1A.F.Ca.ET.072.01.1.1]RUW55574.1 hypothetical protein EOA32_00720 [Mesorhizobium sp. M1A.F.Ca.ET.072.01.1.1]